MEAAVRAAYALNPVAEIREPIQREGRPDVAGVNGQPSGLYEAPKNNLMPAIGATYKLSDKTFFAVVATGCSTASLASDAGT